MIKVVILLILTFLAFGTYRFVSNGLVERSLKVLWLVYVSLFVGGREDIGRDTAGYALRITMGEYGKGWLLDGLMYLTSNFSLPHNYVFVFYSFFTYLFLLLFTNRQPKRLQLLIIMVFLGSPFFFNQTFNIFRQMLSVSIFLYATIYLRNTIVFLILFFLAYLAHPSCLVILPVIAIIKFVKFNLSLEFILSIISLVLFVLPNILFGSIGVFQGYLPLEFNLYLAADRTGYESEGMKFGVMFLIHTSLLVILLLNRNRLVSLDVDYLFHLYLVGLILFYGLQLSIDIVRISYYFIIVSILLIPLAFSDFISPKFQTISRLIILVIFTMYTIINTLNFASDQNFFINV